MGQKPGMHQAAALKNGYVGRSTILKVAKKKNIRNSNGKKKKKVAKK